MGKIKNFQDLKNQKEELRAEIKEIESVLSFENPRKSFGVITNGVTEKYLGGMMDSSLAQNAFFLADKFLFPSLEIGSAKLLSNALLKSKTIYEKNFDRTGRGSADTDSHYAD